MCCTGGREHLSFCQTPARCFMCILPNFFAESKLDFFCFLFFSCGTELHNQWQLFFFFFFKGMQPTLRLKGVTIHFPFHIYIHVFKIYIAFYCTGIFNYFIGEASAFSRAAHNKPNPAPFPTRQMFKDTLAAPADQWT